MLNSDIWFNKCLESQYFDKVFKDVRTIHAGAYETITMSFTNMTITTNSDGNVNFPIPNGTYTFTGSVSGESFTRTVASDTTDVYVMPEGALYWYGNLCAWITGGWIEARQNGNGNCNHYSTGHITYNTNSVELYLTPVGSNGSIISAWTKNSINLDNFNVVKQLCTDSLNNNGILISNRNGISNVIKWTDNTQVKSFNLSNTSNAVAHDISNISGYYYMSLSSWKYITSGSRMRTIKALWLE